MRLSEQRYLHHCSFRSEKNQRTGDNLTTLVKKVCCQLSHFSNTQEREDPYTNVVRVKKRKSSREIEDETIRILLERQKEQILADVRTEIPKHELQADPDSRSIQALNGIVESQRRDIDHAVTVNTIPPGTEIHEQMTMTNGYVEVCTTTSTPSTTVRPLWTIT